MWHSCNSIVASLAVVVKVAAPAEDQWEDGTDAATADTAQKSVDPESKLANCDEATTVLPYHVVSDSTFLTSVKERFWQNGQSIQAGS